MSETYGRCNHHRIALVGGDETGLRSARCRDCQAPMTRRIEAGAYVWETVEAVDQAALDALQDALTAFVEEK